jgi:hypothetical protein
MHIKYRATAHKIRYKLYPVNLPNAHLLSVYVVINSTFADAAVVKLTLSDRLRAYFGHKFPSWQFYSALYLTSSHVSKLNYDIFVVGRNEIRFPGTCSRRMFLHHLRIQLEVYMFFSPLFQSVFAHWHCNSFTTLHIYGIHDYKFFPWISNSRREMFPLFLLG